MSDQNHEPKTENLSSNQSDSNAKGSAEFDKLMEEAEADTNTREPGASTGNHSDQDNNGRGGGK